MKMGIDYIEIDGVLICDIPSSDCLDWEIIEKIAQHTKNTWQKDRKIEEIRKDTAKGKLAELVLENYLEKKTSVRYLSYDSFRNDNYNKHAPFDGLIYSIKIESEILKNDIESIKKDVFSNGAGQISETTRRQLEDGGVFTIEIKSSQMRDRDYDGVECVQGDRSVDDYRTVVRNIRKWDFFTYPHYLRSSEERLSFYEYAELIRTRSEFENLSNQNYLQKLMQKEFDNASDINTRLYFDYRNNQIVIPGYILKDKFFKNPRIDKMLGGKSKKALYYMRSIAEGSSFVTIDQDNDIWESDTLTSYKRIFAFYKRVCPKCGNILQICNAKSSRAYIYRCYKCEKWYTMDQINEG